MANTPAGHGAATYNPQYQNQQLPQYGQGHPPNQGGGQDGGYYNENQGYYGGQQTGATVQQPPNVYGGNETYAPPAGPPPGKEGVVR